MRDSKIDFYKGMLMIGVIWGHTINAYHLSDYTCWIHLFFRTYDMPFFMLLSGAFLARSIQKYDLRNLLLNKFTTLLVPVAVWSLIRTQRLSFDSYYFIPAVFYSSIFVILANFVTNKFLRLVIYLVPFVVLHCTNYWFYNIAYLYPFFLIGFLFFNTEIKIKQEIKALFERSMHGGGKYKDVVFLLIWAFLLCFWSSSYTPWRTGFNVLAYRILPFIMLYRFVLAMIGIIFMKWVFGQLYNSLSLAPFVCKIGSKTLGIYFIQGIAVETLFDNGMAALIYKYHIDSFYIIPFMCYVTAPVIALLTCRISLYLIDLIECNKITKWILGFKISLEYHYL